MRRVPVAGQRILLIARDRVRIHAGEEIVGLVVLTDVIETEMEIFTRIVPALGRAVRALFLAVGPFAHDDVLARTLFLLRVQARLDADGVEEL